MGFNEGVVIARLVFGTMMAAHGGQKLFGWLGGHGLAAMAGMFESLGFRPGGFFAATAASAEFASGVLVLLGLFGPVGPALMLSVMIVAAISVHLPGGLFAATNGVEVPLLYAAAAAALALTGPGRFSLDALLGIGAIWTPGLVWTALAVSVLGAAANLAVRRPPARVAA